MSDRPTLISSAGSTATGNTIDVTVANAFVPNTVATPFDAMVSAITAPLASVPLITILPATVAALPVMLNTLGVGGCAAIAAGSIVAGAATSTVLAKIVAAPAATALAALIW